MTGRLMFVLIYDAAKWSLAILFALNLKKAMSLLFKIFVRLRNLFGHFYLLEYWVVFKQDRFAISSAAHSLLLGFTDLLFYVKQWLDTWVNDVSDWLVVYLLQLSLVLVMKLSEQIRTTILNMTRHVNFMNLSNVIWYIPIAIETFLASNLIASEPLLTKMPSLMLNLVAFGCKAAVAVLALERFIARMNALVK